MTKIILINKSMAIKQLNAKNLDFNTLYKKCGFKNNQDFKKISQHNSLQLWGKTSGTNNSINKSKYIKNLFNAQCDVYGTFVIILVENNTIIDLSQDDLLKIVDSSKETTSSEIEMEEYII